MVTMVTIIFYAMTPLPIHESDFVVLDFTLHCIEHGIQCDQVLLCAEEEKRTLLIQTPVSIGSD